MVVGRDVMEAAQEFRAKVEVETDPDKKIMLGDMCAKINAVATNIEAKLKNETSSPLTEIDTVELLNNAKDVLSEWLDKRLGSTITDHSIFANLAKK